MTKQPLEVLRISQMARISSKPLWRLELFWQIELVKNVRALSCWIIFEPCQLATEACPIQVVKVKIHAKTMLNGSNPVVPSQTSGSNNLTFRWAERIAPKPSPSVQPYGALALSPTVLGLPRRNSVNADSAIPITSAIIETSRILTDSKRIGASIRESMREAINTPETNPNNSVLKAPERS